MSNLSDNSSNSDNDSSDDSKDGTADDTEDEAFSEPIPVNLFAIPGQNVETGQPIKLDVDLNRDQTSYLPLCLMFNSRSVFNKADNLNEMLNQIGPDLPDF